MEEKPKDDLASKVSGCGCLLVIVVVAGAWIGSWASSAASEAKLPASAPTISVAADELDQELSDNEIAAQRKYTGSYINVSGTVKSVSKVSGFLLEDDSATIEFSGKDTISSVMAFLPDQNNAIRAHPGSSATLRCTAVVKEWTGTDLKNCVAVSFGDPDANPPA